jgi:hypothetical protein
MTLITFDNGKPVFRNGKVGTAQGCCCGGICCQCFVRVQYSTTNPEANAKPFSGIAPEDGWTPMAGGFYAEFPCAYYEYASSIGAPVFAHKMNEGADAAYSDTGAWTPTYYPAKRTRCVPATAEANCQPCQTTWETTPTLEQLLQPCGIYHPPDPCKACSNLDGCGSPQPPYYEPPAWPPQENADTWEDTCPCTPCSILCVQKVYSTFQAKPKVCYDINNNPYPCGPLAFEPIPEEQPTYFQPGAFAVGGALSDDGTPFAGSGIDWRCLLGGGSSTNPGPGDMYQLTPGGELPCGGGITVFWNEETENYEYAPPDWADQTYTWQQSYFLVSVVDDCCQCFTALGPSDEGDCGLVGIEGGSTPYGVTGTGCGGWGQLFYLTGLSWTGDDACAGIGPCGRACSEVPEGALGCNPLP